MTRASGEGELFPHRGRWADRVEADLKEIRSAITGLQRLNSRTGIVQRDEQRLARQIRRATEARVVVPLSDSLGAAAAAQLASQPLDPTLTAFGNVTFAADKGVYSTGADAFATFTFTAYGRAFCGVADAAAGRTALALGVVATYTTQTGYSATNDATLRTIDVSTVTLTQLANLVVTIMRDFIAQKAPAA